MKESPLGKIVSYPLTRSPEVLFAIDRTLSRKEIGIGSELPFDGFDEWNSYEFSWLNLKGKPKRSFLQLKIPAASPYIVESKSLKLYLSSYLQESFSSEEEVRLLIESDISACIKAKVHGLLLPPSSKSFLPKEIQGTCLDEEDIEVNAYAYCPDLLRTEPEKTQEEVLYTHLFKSNCPVTGQPDYATIIICYKGQRICKKSLLLYLVSYRNHQEYHECCVERIFVDIQRLCKPDSLSVCARFSRRGGIDINPLRYSKDYAPQEMRRIIFQ